MAWGEVGLQFVRRPHFFSQQIHDSPGRFRRKLQDTHVLASKLSMSSGSSLESTNLGEICNIYIYIDQCMAHFIVFIIFLKQHLV